METLSNSFWKKGKKRKEPQTLTAFFTQTHYFNHISSLLTLNNRTFVYRKHHLTDVDTSKFGFWLYIEKKNNQTNQKQHKKIQTDQKLFIPSDVAVLSKGKWLLVMSQVLNRGLCQCLRLASSLDPSSRQTPSSPFWAWLPRGPQGGRRHVPRSSSPSRLRTWRRGWTTSGS